MQGRVNCRRHLAAQHADPRHPGQDAPRRLWRQGREGGSQQPAGAEDRAARWLRRLRAAVRGGSDGGGGDHPDARCYCAGGGSGNVSLGRGPAAPRRFGEPAVATMGSNHATASADSMGTPRSTLQSAPDRLRQRSPRRGRSSMAVAGEWGPRGTTRIRSSAWGAVDGCSLGSSYAWRCCCWRC